MLTMRQFQLVEAIRTYRRAHNNGPTIRDLQELTGHKSVSTVELHLRSLEIKGLIRREPGLTRTIELVEESPIEVLRRLWAETSEVASLETREAVLAVLGES